VKEALVKEALLKEALVKEARLQSNFCCSHTATHCNILQHA